MPIGLTGATWFLLLTLLAIRPVEISCQCSSSSDIGRAECVLLTPYYSQYQWATCLTRDYIVRTSDRRHICRNYARMCWYQCQIELNGFASGPVYDNCICSPGDTTPPTDNSPTLDPECYSPDGNSCGWYRQCLETRYPCQNTEDGYAIEYAEKFCNLYIDSYNEFSPEGRTWVDGVRKCLQLALVPSLRPWVRKTCADIKSDAFGSHSRCYLNPGVGVPSICELSCSDTFQVFWTVNGMLSSSPLLSDPLETGKQMLEVVWECRGCTNSVTMTAVSVAVPGFRVIHQGLKLIAAGEISQFIARQLRFDDKGIGWFPFVNGSDNDGNSRQRRDVTPTQKNDDQIVLLLVSLASLNSISPPASNSPSVDDIVNEFADAVTNGVLSDISIVVNGTDMTFGVSSLGQCDDLLCSNGTNVTVLATSKGVKIATPFSLYHMIITLCATNVLTMHVVFT